MSGLLPVYIGQLRRKLGDDATNPHFIITEPGIGYRFLDAQEPWSSSQGPERLGKIVDGPLWAVTKRLRR
jgi:DNA-binding winged helix-turn-helix (wHTH) protein